MSLNGSKKSGVVKIQIHEEKEKRIHDSVVESAFFDLQVSRRHTINSVKKEVMPIFIVAGQEIIV